MHKEEIIKILEDNRNNIEKGAWEEVYENVAVFYRSDFSDFLIENGVDPSTMFKDKIYSYAFQDSNLLTSINVADSVTKIECGAFYYCNSLKSITLPDSLTEISALAFNHCTSLEEIKYQGTEEEWNKIQKGQNWNFNCPAKIVFLK